MIFLVPAHLEQLSNQLKFEQEVNTRVVASVDQSLDHSLEPLSFFKERTGPAKGLEVHIKGKFEGRNVSFFFIGATPVDEAVGDV